MKKRLLSILLMCCMVLMLLPTAVFAEGGAKAIQPGPDGIHGYNTESGYSYIYYGTWRDSPIKWRVLDTKANTGAADALFLLTDECLYPLPGDLYACYIRFNPANKLNRHLWKDSTLQDWFKNTFYSGENSAFTSAECALIPATTQAGSVYLYKAPSDPSYFPPMQFQICALEAEYVFAPSIQDIMNAGYGFIDPASRIAGPINSSGRGTRYWLRSFETSEELPFLIGEDASLMGDSSRDNLSAVRPAMNLSTAGNNILFISAAVGGKRSGGLAEIPAYTGNEWKLTLLDSSRSGFSVTTANLSAYTRGGTVKIGYTGAKTGANEYISAMILDAAGNPAYYGRSSAALTDENGTAELTIPALAEGTYTLKVFNEQYNGDKMTDLASAFADVTLTVEEGVDEQFTLAPGGRYYFDLSAMNIPGTANSGNSFGAVSLPDTSLHYVPFTYAGTVDAYKLMLEMVTTEKYAQREKYPHSLFIADYVVTHTVSWDDLNTKSLIFGKDYVAGGVGYTLRAPSVGSARTGSSEPYRGTPQSNEWDRMLDKDEGHIKNWSNMYSWGQDASNSQSGTVAVCGNSSARYRNVITATNSYSILGFRPVLEVPNPGTLGADGLKAVTLNLGGGKLGGSSDAIQIIVKKGSTFTAPMSGGLTRPDGDTGSYFMWLDGNGNSYEPGGSVPADVTELTVQWTAPTYTVTLNAGNGTINSGNVTGYTYGVGATLPTADDMTYTGHTFKGWYDNEGLTGSPVTAIGGTEMGNKEYWAKWEINQYTITVKPENGKADITITQDYGTPITAPTLTREGYQFNGWDKTFPTTMPAENLTITAQWRYNGGGGSGYSYYTIKATAGAGGSISPSGNVSVREGRDQTFTITPDKGYAVANVKIDGKSIGAVKSYTFENVRRTHTIEVIFMKANGNPQTGVFVDVATGSYYEDAVDWAAENGITGGVGSSLFAPNQPCTRAQIVTFLWRAAGSPVVNYLMPFTDVDEGAYYAEAVRWAASTGIVTGLTETTFGTDSVCTRAQAAAMIYRCAQAQGKGFTGAWMFHLPFTDVPEWAYESVAWCYMNGVTTGVSETSFAPGNDCTRAQIVTFLWRCKK